MSLKNRLQIKVSGIVQGIGFRPYIYRLANRLQLDGFVNNNSNGVLIEIEGNLESTRLFLQALSYQPPPLAQITELQYQQIPLNNDSGFKIHDSRVSEQRTTLISPDIATCVDCLNEMNDPADRRYQYPFINCTNCGPRYTIISDIPYDRPKTSMSGFTMCAECQSEYDNPDDRRFHAQPNACPVCGPTLRYFNRDQTESSSKPIMATISDLKAGQIVAIKGIGGFHLAVDATNNDAVRSLRERKKRFEKPLALMVKDENIARKYAHVSNEEMILLKSLQRPIVLCKKKRRVALSSAISPDNEFFGLILPYAPLHKLLFESGKLDVLVMTSANISEEPICFENDECISRMNHIADGYLMHDREIYIRCDDSVLQFDGKDEVFIRRSRGYSPRPIVLKARGVSVLAVGGQLKNTICLTRDNFAFMSQHIGDLENLQTLQAFEKTIQHIQNLFEIEPELIVHDLHPEYLSTKWAQDTSHIPTAPVQHHYAHILSVMAENGLEEEVLGFSLDGTGYGEDGAIWGGEVLLCNPSTYERLAFFDYVPMPGGERAIKEPWRMAVAYLDQYLNDDGSLASGFFPGRVSQLPILKKMIEKELNTPHTSSCGRLFDAVAALLGLREVVAYEGQAAIMLEAAAHKNNHRVPSLAPFEITKKNDMRVIVPGETIKDIIKFKRQGRDTSEISMAFHTALIDIFVHLAVLLRDERGVKKIALSGGCFQNLLLRSGLSRNLKEKGFDVYTNIEVPPNDGGLALGQAYWGILNNRRNR